MYNRNRPLPPEEERSVHRGASPGNSSPLQQDPTQSRPTPINPTPTYPTKEDLGFADIPTDEDDMENVRFRDILRAWAKQSIKDSALEDKIKSAKQRNSRLQSLKNDLKWAMQADLDEPVKPHEKPKTPNHTLPPLPRTPAKNTVNKTTQENKTIDININFGSFPKIPLFSQVRQKTTLLKGVIFKHPWKIGATAASLGLIVILWQVLPGITSSGFDNNARNTTSENLQKPEYQTILPTSKSIDELGGWHRVSPPDRDAVFAYKDKINDTSINVSQQPLPDDFKKNSEESIANLAKNYAATHKIDAGSTTVYLGTSAQGPQSAILTKNNLLILIKSSQKISDDAWKKYIQSLN